MTGGVLAIRSSKRNTGGGVLRKDMVVKLLNVSDDLEPGKYENHVGGREKGEIGIDVGRREKHGEQGKKEGGSKRSKRK